MIPNIDEHIFQRGWFDHQLVKKPLESVCEWRMNTKMMIWKRYARYHYPLLSFLCLFLGYPCWKFSVPFDRCFLLKQGLTFGKIPLFLWAWDLCNQFARSDWWGFGEVWIQWVQPGSLQIVTTDPQEGIVWGGQNQFSSN